MTQKVFVSHDNMATFVCPKCKNTKRMNVISFLKLENIVKLKHTCTCKHIYSVILERRKCIRKKVHLTGNLIRGKEQKPLVINELSRYGLKFKVFFKTKIEIGDQLLIEFTLDDAKRSVTKQKIVVRNKIDQYNGAEFITTEHYGNFGSYILYNL